MKWLDQLSLLLGAASPFATQDPALATAAPDAKPMVEPAAAKRDVTYWRDPAQTKRLLELAGHRSHRSHSSHRSSSGGYRTPSYTPPPAPRATAPRSSAPAPLYSPPSTPTATPFMSSAYSTPSERIGGRAFSQAEIRQIVSRVQSALTVRGYDTGGVDGLMGDNTRSALRRYQANQGLSQTGYLDLSTLDALGVTVETPSLGAVTTLPDVDAIVPPIAAPTQPVWIDQPTASDLERLRPQGVFRSVEGGAIIQCRVADDGTLSGCIAISETPPGRRYGQAAVRAAALYRMRIDGAFADFVGQTVEIAVRWPVR